MTIKTPTEVLDKIEACKKSRSTYLDLSQCDLKRIPIEIRELTWLTILDLSFNQIIKIEGLEQLINLKNLSFVHNQIRRIEGLEQLTRLEKLFLNQNRITKIEGLEQLTNLINLGLTGNEIIKIESLTQLENLENLWLNRNHIVNIEGLDKLDKLTMVDFNENQIKDISPLLKYIKTGISTHYEEYDIGKQGIYLLNNPFETPDIETVRCGNDAILDYFKTPKVALYRIEECKRVKSTQLDLYKLNLKIIPWEVTELTWLHVLNLGNNQITKITNLDNLSNVKYLYLENNQITKIENLGKLANLSELQLANNQITKIENLEKLTNLSELSLGNNQITKIEKLEKLEKLHRLNLGANSISKIENLDKLSNLETLVLYHNKITKIEGLNSLANLGQLWLDSNQITKIEGLEQLTNLKDLLISRNQITKIEGLEKLIKLAAINFEDNQIKDIKPLLKYIKNGISVYYEKHNNNISGIYLFNNPLETPDIETVRRGNEAILTYFEGKEKREQFEIEHKDDAAAIAEYQSVKLVLLGNSGVGKSNFSEYLREMPLSVRNTTHGMAIDTWLVKNQKLRVRIWDFGGQEYYHDTYRLFFQGNCLFAVLWDATKNNNRIENEIIDAREEEAKTEAIQHFKYDYWLDSFAHYASKGQFVLVQNKADRPDLVKRVNEDKLYKSYPQFLESYAVSLHEGTKQEASEQTKQLLRLKEDLIDNLLALSNKTTFTYSRIQLRNQLIDFQSNTQEEQANNPFFRAAYRNRLSISKEEFRQIVSELKLDEALETVLDDVLLQLVQQGILLHFEDIEVLRNDIFIHPLNLSEEIYTVLSKEIKTKHKGQFTKSDLKSTKITQDTLLALMLKLNIIFEIPSAPNDVQQYIAPQYLPDTHLAQDLYDIATSDLKSNTYYIRLPLFYYRRVIQQLILHYGKQQTASCTSYFWKHGILLKKEAIVLLIKGLYPSENENEGIISVASNQSDGFLELQKTVFTMIRAELPSTTPIEVSLDNQYFIPYAELENKAQNEEQKFTLSLKDGTSKSFITNHFKAMLDKTPKRPLKVFISYAHKDGAIMDDLKAHLQTLRRAQIIDTWEDGKVEPGEEWNERILTEIRNADVVIMLMSAYFIDSDYIWEKEIKIALENRKRGKLLLPVYVKAFDFSNLTWKPKKETLKEGDSEVEEFELSKIQWMPFNADRKLQAVATWQDRDEALAEVARKIREAITRFDTEDK
ncbi:MAG: hypothetical protein RLZZ292_361 [Bacteroidota bacterium]|jgi:internalin A